MKSAVLKPINRILFPRKHSGTVRSWHPHARQAAALAASCAASGQFLDGPRLPPRRVEVDGVRGFVENGVACEILVSQMADIIPAKNPADEMFNLSAAQVRIVVGLIGLKKRVDLSIFRIRSQTTPCSILPTCPSV